MHSSPDWPTIERCVPLALQHGTLNSFNDALKCLGIQVKAAEDADVSEGDWSVLDGKTLVRYRDGLVSACLLCWLCPCGRAPVGGQCVV